jgi:hypothetical protein
MASAMAVYDVFGKGVLGDDGSAFLLADHADI